MIWTDTTSGAGIKQEIQDYLQDASFAVGGSNETKLLRWANRLLRVINLELHPNPYLFTSSAIDLTISTRYTALPTDFSVLASAPVANGIELQEATIQDINSFNPAIDATATYPTHYAIMGNNIYFYPVPSATTASAVTIYYYRLPNEMYGSDGDSADTPDGIPTQFHHIIVDGVTHMALLWLDEKDIRDTQIIQLLSMDLSMIRNYLKANAPDAVQFVPRTS